MALKTFNVENSIYQKFSGFCRANGMSMSKQVEFFMRSVVEEEPSARKEFLDRLENIRNGRFTRVENFSKEFGLKHKKG